MSHPNRLVPEEKVTKFSEMSIDLICNFSTVWLFYLLLAERCCVRLYLSGACIPKQGFKKELLGKYLAFFFVPCFKPYTHTWAKFPWDRISHCSFITALISFSKTVNKFEHFYKAGWNFKLLKHFTMRDRNLSALSRELIAVESRQRNNSSSNRLRNFPSVPHSTSRVWLSKTEKIFHTP